MNKYEMKPLKICNTMPFNILKLQELIAKETNFYFFYI